MIDIAKKRWHFFIIVTIVGFFFDWLTKSLVLNNLEYAKNVPVIGEVFQLYFVYNKGALFGLSPKALFPNFPVNAFFYVFSAIASALIIYYYKNIEDDKKLSLWGVAVLMPGALGNLFDRVVHAKDGVIDFIKVDLNFPPFDPWPIFNFADIYITIGIAIIFVEMLFFDKKEKGVNDEA